MPTTTLDRRALNRALLERQLLLERAKMPAIEAVERLLGMQSQAPGAPYIGLWTRLRDFSFDELAQLMKDRGVVRLTLMRGTVHLVSAADALLLRPLLQPVLDRMVRGAGWGGTHLKGVDRDELVAAGRELLGERPRSPRELRELLAERWPDTDPDSLEKALRSWAPLVQLPPRGLWGESGQPTYATAEDWLGAPLAAPDPGPVVERYLAAFGPATVADIQKWSGLTGLRQVVAGLDLRTYRDEDGRELHDLPGAVLPDRDTPVPARFIADFDNLLLSHADRTRIVAEEYRGRVMTVNGIVHGTILVDGFVGGTWRFDRTKGSAAVFVTPFAPLTAGDRDALGEEGARLLAASDPSAGSHEVRIEPAV
ncbi:winged helix DNA-binding domain-containing protein [Streptomyces sp. H10-C2]|uniref:winged helix DNA-binding domain-containing protein n=1 Tax=unclassified Streptomyces TaxID=2593676 RepID=UPI0024B88D15|nr:MULTISPECIES: winged helix DNA-binding domain-containing protein [unclassified Streptomyces]MDJ0340748.1 winged helix DNA-binding domain-containing protein [Streptomyces sp. PH10-H1]MDJ0371980.1 winged helix DNA-binding domain-containing protein [Streptomyces sp. H10-C2]